MQDIVSGINGTEKILFTVTICFHLLSEITKAKIMPVQFASSEIFSILAPENRHKQLDVNGQG